MFVSAPDYYVKYKIGEWVEAPKNTGLFVFNSFYRAELFAAVIPYCRIFECECEEEIKPSANARCDSNISIKRTWAFAWLHRLLQNNKMFPSGTKCFKRVKLVREVPIIR